MCGISGILSFMGDTDVVSSIGIMNKTIAHRGPDGEGVVLFNHDLNLPVYTRDTPAKVVSYPLPFCPKHSIESRNGSYYLALGHRRLSVIDLEPSGHQPMCSENEQLWITYNGEIYNYLELKEELRHLGYRFYTNSDTEVILCAYQEWGNKCLNKFNGMWAFVIYDKARNKLFAARDRFGVKPFYYSLTKNVFCFASEQKALKALPFVQTSLNLKATYDFFIHTELEYEPEGLFKNIIELFPSTYLELDLSTKKISLSTYYELKINDSFTKFNEGEFIQLKKKIRELFIEAVSLRLRSDVQVGSCLSGGIDSSAIVGVMNYLNGNDRNKINLFSAVFSNQSIDESKWAKLVVNASHSNWHKVTPNSENLMNDLSDLIYCQDIPLWSTSTYAQYRVMQLAAQNNVKVVLDGQGGDELFAGYLPYFAWYWSDLAKNKQWKTLKNELLAYASLGKGIQHYAKEKIKHQFNMGRLGYLSQMKDNRKKYFEADFLELHAKDEKSRIEKMNNPSSLNQKLRNEFSNTRLKGYLKCEDRCGMRWGVESRTPFADDIKLIEAVFSVPSVYKMKNGTTKYLLRESLKDFLPDQIYRRKDKMGYLTPNNQWLYELRHDLLPLLDENNGGILKAEVIKKELEKLGSRNLTGENALLFKSISFLVWRKKFGI